MFLEHLKNQSQANSNFSLEEEGQTESHALRFLQGLGDASEWGAYFSGGVVIALICRLIPRLLIFYLLFVAASVGYLWLLYKAETRRAVRQARLAGLAIILSLIGGTWDAALLILASLSLWQIIALSAIAVGLIWVLIELLRYQAGR